MILTKLSPIEGDPAYITVRDSPYFDHDAAIRLMLKAGAIETFCNEEEDVPVTVGVNSRDFFAWDYFDFETLRTDHIEPLYHEWRKNPKWGSTIWVLKKYNRQPQPPLKELLIKEGAWTPELEALDANPEGTLPEGHVFSKEHSRTRSDSQ